MAEIDLADDYRKLLEFICSCEKIGEIKDLFQDLDRFWQSQFAASPLLVYSVAKERDEEMPKNLRPVCRGFWNREKEIIYFTEEEVNFFLQHIYSDRGLAGNWKSYKLAGSHFYIFSCGHSESQEFFGVFKSERSIGKSVMDYLNQFLNSTFEKIAKLKEVDKLQNLVHIDDVTGLYNQRKFIKDIDELIDRYERSKEVFSVIFLDIDHFKKVNDGHGHLVGTKLLSDVAGVLTTLLRDDDLSYRYGGDEFVVILPGVDPSGAFRIGERILEAVKKRDFEVDESQGLQGAQSFKLTVSVGVANFPEDANSRTEIIAMADRMMYEAKKTGRGKVCHAGKNLVKT